MHFSELMTVYVHIYDRYILVVIAYYKLLIFGSYFYLATFTWYYWRYKTIAKIGDRKIEFQIQLHNKQ